VKLVRSPSHAISSSVFDDEPLQDSDDFLWASLARDADELVVHISICDGLGEDDEDEYFICDLTAADESEKTLASSLVRHLRHYHMVREREQDLLSRFNDARAEITALEEKNRLLQREIYGASSEKNPIDIDGPVSEPPTDLAERTSVFETPSVKKDSHRGRKPLPENLPREDVLHDIPLEDRTCTECSSQLRPMGIDVSEQLVVIPAHFQVRRHLRHKYSCPVCQTVVCACIPRSMIPGGSYSSPEFLAHIATSRYQFGLPFYRQEAMFHNAGIKVNRTTLAGSMIRCVEKLEPLMAVLQCELLSQPIIHADETRLQVLKEPGRLAQAQSFLWLYRSGQRAARPVVIFQYQQDRSGKHPQKFLSQNGGSIYNGFLQVDGYSGYNQIAGVRRVGCMAHVRRKFVEALEGIPARDKKNSHAAAALDLIGRLYAIERKIIDQPPKDRWIVRQKESAPILLEFHSWLSDLQSKVLPKGLLGRAVGYAVEQWSYVSRYVEDGRLAIDNNVAEREIKAVVIGRKNWLFADSPAGARANAVFYSIVRSAIANGLDPYAYLKEIFEKLPNMTTADEVESLAPWNCLRPRAEVRLAA
jgi:transposase